MNFSDHLRAHDDAAWALLMEYDRLPAVYARRLGLSDPDAVAGEAWLRFWQAVTRGVELATPGAAVAYWQAVARTAAIDARRGAAPPGEPLGPMAWHVAAPAPTPEQAAIRAEERAALWANVAARLPTPAARVAVGTRAAGLSAAETAAHWPHLFADGAAVSKAREEALRTLAAAAGRRRARPATVAPELDAILALRAQGHANPAIARLLGLSSPHAVRNCLAAARRAGMTIPRGSHARGDYRRTA